MKKRLIINAAKGMFPSARKLADAIKPETQRKVYVVRNDSPTFKPKPDDVIINWGNSTHPEWKALAVAPLNHPDNVAVSINKLYTFLKLEEQNACRIPEFSVSFAARDWFNDGLDIICRHTLVGFGGAGIELVNNKTHETLPDAHLYVLYKKKAAEFRVHVFKNVIIDVTQKKVKEGVENVNRQIRNHANGWVYCRENIDVPGDVFKQAVAATAALGLDFGAVDVIWNHKEQQAYVLEVNSAPGLEGQTLTSYKEAILAELQ
jgi:glutathione synthase/RimK-type ligase-like ATP-grasp enzyme